MVQALRTVEIAEPNAFAVDATVAAFSDEGWEWLTALREYIDGNKKTVYAFLKKELPDVYALPPAATYLMWLDISRYTDDSGELQRFLRKNAGLFVMPGREYAGNGNLFLRLNTACPRSMLEDGLNRLKAGLDLWRSRT